MTPGGLDTTYAFDYGSSPTALNAHTASHDAGAAAAGSVPVEHDAERAQAQQDLLLRAGRDELHGHGDGFARASSHLDARAARRQAQPRRSPRRARRSAARSRRAVFPRATPSSTALADEPRLPHLDPQCGCGGGRLGAGECRRERAQAAADLLLPAHRLEHARQPPTARRRSSRRPPRLRRRRARPPRSARRPRPSAATVSPGGLATTYWFEYGASNSTLDHVTARLERGRGNRLGTGRGRGQPG